MRVAISGGGVAGLSCGAVLAKHGHQVTVYEREPTTSHIGAGVVCFSNATLVLRRLGLEDAVSRVAGRPSSMCRLSQRGERLGELPIAAIDRHIGAPSYSILRGELMRILREFAKQHGVRIEYGRHVLGVTEDGALRLADGSQHAADWLIGADGRMNSPLRRHVLGDAAPRYAGFVNWIGIARASSDSFEPRTIYDVWGRGERFGVVPINARVAYFAGGAASPLRDKSEGPWLTMLRERFDSWPAPVRQALEHADPASLNEIYVHDLEPSNCWHRDNVLLIGDAAHAPLPTSGQGACQALEDAYHMDRLLSGGGSLEPEVFFESFTAARRDKANAIIQTGRSVAASLFTTDASRIVERDRQSRQTDFTQAAQGVAGLWGSGFAAQL